jgi:hypothetical protein
MTSEARLMSFLSALTRIELTSDLQVPCAAKAITDYDFQIPQILNKFRMTREFKPTEVQPFSGLATHLFY